MKPAYLVMVVIAICTVISCQNNASDEKQSQEVATKYKSAGETVGSSVPMSDSTTDNMADPPQEPQQDDKKQQKQQPSQQTPARVDWDKKIIKTASLNAEVKDYNKYYASLREKVKALGGYIAQEEQNQSEYKIENSLVIKVPVDQFDNAIVQLSASTEKINERKVSSQDVTAEMVDTRSRMEAKKQVRLRYMDLLKEARTMQDILSVQSEINGIQEEIESAAGRIEYMGHAAAFSTINLTYYQVLNATAISDKDNPSFGTRLGAAFKSGTGMFKDLFVGLVTVWPLFLISAIVILVVKRYSNKKGTKFEERRKQV